MGARNTTKARKKPTQSRSQATVDAVLTATAYVLAESGFAGATTNRIAEVAGVNIGTLYRYFPSKDALVGALIDREANSTLSSVERILEAGEHEPLEVVVRALLVAMTEEQRLDPRVHRELVEQVGRSGRVSVLRNLEQSLADRLASFIGRRAQSGSTTDPFVTAFLVLHTMEALTHAILFLRPPRVSRADALDGAVELVTRFLMPATNSPPR